MSYRPIDTSDMTAVHEGEEYEVIALYEFDKVAKDGQRAFYKYARSVPMADAALVWVGPVPQQLDANECDIRR